MKITILIPILNEEVQIRKRAEVFHQMQNHPSVHQLLFSDSGSTDSGIEYLRFAGFECQQKSFRGSASIGQAIFQCIDRIQTEKVLILPVDVQLDGIHLDLLEKALMNDPGPVYVFQKQYDTQNPALKLGQWLLRFVREGLLKNFVWTNAFCICKEDMNLVPRIGFLEDVLLNDQLKKTRTIFRLGATVTVSARKYVNDGPWFRLFINLLILGLFRTSLFKPMTLKKLYRLSKQPTKEGDFHEKDTVRWACDSALNVPTSFRIG
ncbi:MAG: hypothetical protein IPK04_19930 [Bdellovibrionales bacterium]|jgi:hypothetical protein|nr:hypothetical protein [Bdellovibrionales bacterium]